MELITHRPGLLSEALIIDPGDLVTADCDDVLAGAGFHPERESYLPRAFLTLFRTAVPLLILGHAPPALDVDMLVRSLRRAPDCASRRAQIFVVVAQVSAVDVAAARDSGADQLAAGLLSPHHLMSMLTAMAKDTRRFVECDSYVGPDRRVKQLTTFGFHPQAAERL